MSGDEDHDEPTTEGEPTPALDETETETVDDDVAGPIVIEPEPAEAAVPVEEAVMLVEDAPVEDAATPVEEAAVPEPVDEVPTTEVFPTRPAPPAPPIAEPPIAEPPRTPSYRLRTPEPGAPTFVSRSPTASLVRMMRPNKAVILLGAVFLLAVIEIIAAFLAYREQIDDQDWDDVAALLVGSEAEPVLVSSEWLAPRARMQLPQARMWDSVAPPDLRGMTRFWVLSYGRDPWTPELRAELEDLPMPDLIAIHTVGGLLLNEYQQVAPGERLWSLLERELAVESDAGPCVGKRDQWNCKDGRARVRVIEVDYRPRRCLALSFDEHAIARIDLGEVELGNRLRGHVGFGDFNARLRADPTVVLEAWIDEQPVARWLFTDDQGWAAFALATEPGTHALELRVSSTFAGTWQRDGHRPLPTDTVCIEARAFVEAEPEAEEVSP